MPVPGVQALSNARDLAFLGRNHSIDDALVAVEHAKRLFPGRYSIGVTCVATISTVAKYDNIILVCKLSIGSVCWEGYNAVNLHH